jgi:hypothetical protein
MKPEQGDRSVQRRPKRRGVRSNRLRHSVANNAPIELIVQPTPVSSSRNRRANDFRSDVARTLSVPKHIRRIDAFLASGA